MKIKQSVINTLKRIGIDPDMQDSGKEVTVTNRFGYGSCKTTLFIATLIEWVYNTSDDYEAGIHTVTIDDFDRIRYFILEIDKEAYMTCID